MYVCCAVRDESIYAANMTRSICRLHIRCRCVYFCQGDRASLTKVRRRIFEKLPRVSDMHKRQTPYDRLTNSIKCRESCSSYSKMDITQRRPCCTAGVSVCRVACRFLRTWSRYLADIGGARPRSDFPTFRARSLYGIHISLSSLLFRIPLFLCRSVKHEIKKAVSVGYLDPFLINCLIFKESRPTQKIEQNIRN